jgi:DNA-binding MarR family transcriptional regulator
VNSLDKDLDQFDQAINRLFLFLKSPSTWSSVTVKAGVNINRPGAHILRTMMLHSGSPLTITQIADILCVEAPSISREVKDLEKLGLVRRTHRESDKRTVYLEASAKGKKFNVQLNNARQAITKSALSKWSESERRTFVKLFDKYTKDVTEETK